MHSRNRINGNHMMNSRPSSHLMKPVCSIMLKVVGLQGRTTMTLKTLFRLWNLSGSKRKN